MVYIRLADLWREHAWISGKFPFPAFRFKDRRACFDVLIIVSLKRISAAVLVISVRKTLG